VIHKARKVQLQSMGLPNDVETIKRARIFAMRSGLTISELAEMANLNPNSLRVFLSGSYDKHQGAESNTLPIRAALKQAIDLHEVKHHARRDDKHYSTAEFEEVRASMLDALDDGSAVLVDGAPGIGKSWALENVTEEINRTRRGRAVYVYCTIGLSPQSFLVEVCTEAGIPNRGNKTQLLRKLQYFFEEEHPLLVIDEAQNLPFETLETLRKLIDLRGYGIVLAASYDLVVKLREYKLQMWSSRINRTHLLTGPTKAEAARMLTGELGPMHEDDIASTIADATVSGVRDGSTYKYISLRNLAWWIRDARKVLNFSSDRKQQTVGVA